MNHFPRAISWTNTLEGSRKANMAARSERFQAEEFERQKLDLQEANIQLENRRYGFSLFREITCFHRIIFTQHDCLFPLLAVFFSSHINHSRIITQHEPLACF